MCTFALLKEIVEAGLSFWHCALLNLLNSFIHADEIYVISLSKYCLTQKLSFKIGVKAIDVSNKVAAYRCID